MCGERNCEKTYHPRTMCVFRYKGVIFGRKIKKPLISSRFFLAGPAERNEQTALAIPSGLSRGEHASERGKRAREM